MWTIEDEQALREDMIEKIISKANEGEIDGGGVNALAVGSGHQAFWSGTTLILR